MDREEPLPEGARTEIFSQDIDPELAVPQPETAPIGGVLGPVTVRSLSLLAAPAIIEQILQAIVGLTDTVVAGHLPGDARTIAAASAAVGAVSYLQWFVSLMTNAFGVGATAIVARAIGARRPRVASRTAGTALSGAFIVGLGLALAFFLLSRQVVWLVGLREQAGVYGQQFLRIMVITICLQTASQIGTAALRGAGDTFRPMLITVVVTALNTLTSSALGLGLAGLPAMGVRGIALGTMVAYLVGGVATVVLLFSGTTRIRLQLRHLRLVPHVLRRVLRIGLPSWLEGMLLWAGQLLIVILVITPNDAAVGISGVTMAAHNAVLRIESIAFLPGFGFGIAAASLVGQYLGAGQPLQARRAAFMANRLAFIFMTIAAMPMVLVPGHMLSLLVGSAPVVRTGFWPMVLAGLAQPGFSIAIIMSSALRGAGDTIWPMVSTLVGTFLVRIPLVAGCVWLFTRWGHPDWGLTAVWVGILCDLNARALATAVVFLRGRWQYQKV